ncbi:MAG: hypothetical protein IPO18_15215 [bacterium]|nr:hypothetical protein [bacterium]
MKIRRISIVASCLSVVTALSVVGLSMLGGCRAFQPEAVQVNKAPETYIIGAPPEDAGGYYHFHVYWYGRDEDGKVERFVWALTDTTMQDPDTTDDEEDQRFNPALDASTLAIGRWTTRTDSIFNFTIGQGTATSTHKTLHMVAIDDFGAYDRTPARLHFFTNTLGSPDLRFFRVEGTDTIAVAAGQVDTVGFGKPYRLIWRGQSPNVRGYSPEALALVDTVAPFNDGLFGYKWKLNGALGGDCQPSLTDCWSPRRFNEATNDSFSFFGSVTSLFFANDGSGTSAFRKRLPSGTVSLEVNSIDIAGVEVANYLRPFSFIVNYDPETLILDGETDWAHPSDGETYPYYIRLNDPTRTHYPFQSGDRIPDRTYVVVKALARDSGNDERLNPDFKIGFTGYLQGVRQNFTGGLFPFVSEASALNLQPIWDAGVNGWYGDTLGFLTAPNSRFTINMQSVDEHQRRDGSPAALSFDVGYEPCLQCIEVLPKPNSSTSAFDINTACVEDTDQATWDAHPCLAGVTQLRVAGPGVVANPLTDLEAQPDIAYTMVNRDTGFVTNILTRPVRADSAANYIVAATRYKMAVLVHGKDDPAEAWSQPVRRLGGIKYEVAYDCDPFNEIKDGGGNDDIGVPTWGQPATGGGLVVSTTTGLWKVEVDVYVPTQLMQTNETIYRIILANPPTSLPGPDIDMFMRAITRQFGDGWVDAVVLDQTASQVNPIRPSVFNFFRNVRPGMTIAANQTWRDAGLSSGSIKDRLPLSQGAMASLNGESVRKHFRLVLQPNTGPAIVCNGD